MKLGHLLVLSAASIVALSPAAADPARNEAVARAALEELLGQGRFERSAEYYDSDFVFHGDDRDYSRAEVEQSMRGLRAAFPDIAVQIERLVAAGDLVSVHWSANGTNSVRAGGFPGTGRRVRFVGMAFLRFQAGRMVEEWAVYDGLALQRQLGLSPQPSSQR